MQILKFPVTLFFTFISVAVFSQTDSIKNRIDPKTITTQGQQEQYWAQEIFDKKYSVQHFEKYKGTVTVVSKNTFRYNENIITAGFHDEDLSPIFEKGIIYPAIFFGYNDGRILKVDKSSNFLARNDSLGISIVEELRFLNPSARIKRYKLYLWRPGFANASMYLFELTNENSTAATDLKTFLTGSNLTFLEFVSILM